MAEDTPDLEAFLAGRDNKSVCATCLLPQEARDQIDAVVKASKDAGRKAPWTAICEWLRKSVGLSRTPEAVKRHYDRGHHER